MRYFKIKEDVPEDAIPYFFSRYTIYRGDYMGEGTSILIEKDDEGESVRILTSHSFTFQPYAGNPFEEVRIEKIEDPTWERI